MYQSSLPPSDAPEPLLPVNGPANLSQPVTLPVVPAANQTGDTQQVRLIQALGRFNTQTDELLQQQPNLETVYQQQLAALFPDLQRPINPNHIFYSRYREDVPGQKQWLGSEPLGSLLARLRGSDAQAYLTQESGAFYRESGTVDEGKRLSAASPTATLAGVLEIAFTVKLNEFWRDREGDQPTLEERLVDLRRQVLAHQLALRTLDGTLSAASRTLADTVLKYPTAAARKKVFPTGPRPAVYRLALDNGSEFAAAFILNATGGTPPVGSVLLFSPGEGFEEFENLARLNETVAARLRASDPAGQRLIASLPLAAQAHASDTPILASDPARIEADVIADHVRSLRVRQYFNTRAALRQQTLPLAGELALVADLAPHLDVSAALAARNLRLVAPHDPVWLSTASPADQQLYRQLETTLVDNNEALRPLLEQISTLPAFAEDETRKVLSRQKPEYANVDLDVHKSLVRLRVSTSMPVKVTGYRDDESETVYICEDPQLDIPLVLTEQTLTFGTWNAKEVVDLRTLGSYARRNVDAWSPHELHRTITATADLFDTRGEKVGRLDNADLRALALQADIGQQYAAYLRAAFAPDGEGRAFASAWQRANAARMRKDALESRLNPAVNDLFIFKTPGGGLDWVQAVAQHPDPTTRPKVGQFDIEVNLLVMGGGLEGGQGGQVINGVLVIQRKGTRPGGVCVLYTPEAPDDAPFRELVLGLAELDTLKAKPEWRAYFSQRMATHDVRELSRVFNDTRSVHRYALTPITAELHAYLYSAQLGFQLSHADYRSRTNAEIALESAVNGFLFSVEVADFLLGLSLFKALRRLAHRYIVRGVRNAQKLGRSIPGLIRKIGEDKKASIVLAKPAIRSLDPAWVDVAEYRLPHSIDALFDVEAFAQTHHFRLSRAMGAPSFMDSRNQQFVAMMGNDGRYYLYASHVEEGARFIKHPTGNKPDFMVVPGDAKSWKPRFERTTRGGGSVLGVLGGRTAEQQVHDDLIAAMRIYSSATHGEAMLKEVTASQKRRLLDNALERLGVDEATFRRIVWGQRGVPAPRLRETLLNIEFEANLYTHLNKTTYFLSGQLTLSSEEMENLFIKIKRIVGRNDDFSKHIRASISIIDHDTGATFVGYAFTQKQLNSLTKFDNKFHLSTWRQETLEAFVREKGRTKIVQDIATQHNISFNEALKKLLEAPSIQEALETFRTERRRELLLKLGVDSFSDDFKKAGIPYIALSHGERTGAVSSFKAVDSVTVAEFERTIPKFSTPLEFQPAHPPLPRGERLPQRPQTPVPPSPVTPSGDGAAHIVRFDELMETQLSLLPANAKSKIDEIVQDIQGGRVSGKKIGSYSYVDLPQLDPGAGRGRWRVALEKTGKDGEKDVYVLRGIIDYHGSRRKTWGL